MEINILRLENILENISVILFNVKMNFLLVPCILPLLVDDDSDAVGVTNWCNNYVADDCHRFVRHSGVGD